MDVRAYLFQSNRSSHISKVVNNRRALQDFTFSDGTTVPAGLNIAVPAYIRHHDEV